MTTCIESMGSLAADSVVQSATNNDPVTQAVLDNILGKLPTKKPVIKVTCDVCNLEFSGQVVLEMHLAGAKHAKKLKSIEILSKLTTTGENFTTDDKTKIFRCEVCNIAVNSSQQLQTHLTGNKHKGKMLKLSSVQGIAAAFKQNGHVTPANGKDDNVSMSNAKLPDGVQVLLEAAGTKIKRYYCDICNVSLNSEMQLNQHLESRKHKDRQNPKPKRPAPYHRRTQPAFSQGRTVNNGKYQSPLSSNCIRGEKINEHSTSYSPERCSNYSNYNNLDFSLQTQY